MWKIKALALAAAIVSAYGWGYYSGRMAGDLRAVKASNAAWAERNVLTHRLQSADRELAEKKALIMRGVAIETIKYRDIYHEKIISVPDYSRCIVDSGLLDLYRASLGFTRATVGSNGPTR